MYLYVIKCVTLQVPSQAYTPGVAGVLCRSSYDFSADIMDSPDCVVCLGVLESQNEGREI